MKPFNFLKKLTFEKGSRKLHLQILSLIIAMVLWMLVLTGDTVEMTARIPLEIVVSKGMTISNEVPDEVTFTLSGPRAFLKRLDPDDLMIQMDLRNIEPGFVTLRVRPSMLDVPKGVRVLQYSPSYVTPRLETLVRKKVRVNVSIMGSPPKGYRVVSVKVSPKVISINGPESIIKRIDEVKTEMISLDQKRKSFTIEVPLRKSIKRKKIRKSIEKVTVTIQLRAVGNNQP